MSVRTIITCNGLWPGKPCPSFFTSPGAKLAAKVREEAHGTGWSTEPQGRDFCPAHTRQRR